MPWGGWKSFFTWRVSKTSTLPASKGLNWLSTASGELVIGKFFPCQNQVCLFLMAVSLRRDFRPSRPVVSKRFIDGSRAVFLGQIGQGCSQLDLYVLNSYSPTNSQGASSEAREGHELSRAAHWQKCERVLRRIPRRCELVWAMDGNARMGTALPWVGAGGSRSKHREVWNCNGGDMFDILKEHHLKAAM